MRLVTRKLWRAFPELDRFSDEQCQRFVKAANRRLSLRLVRWGLMAVVWALVTFSPLLLAFGELVLVEYGWRSDTSASRWLGRTWWVRSDIGMGLTMVLMLALGGLGAGVVRDWLLRRRVRRVLRTRGRCAACHYFLAGLPVTASCTVVCPECGHTTEVDASLGELQGGGPGQALFAPSEKLVRESEPWLTPKRVKKWAKRGAAAVAAVLLLAGGLWGWHEWRLSRQASRAVSLKPGAAALMDLAAGAQTPGLPEDAVNAFSLFATLSTKMAKTQGETFPQELSQRDDGLYVYAGGEWIAQREYPGENERAAKERALNEPHSIKVLEAFEKQGLFTDMRAMVDAPLAVAVINHPQQQPLLTAVLGDYSKIRQMARWNAGRMRLAVRNDDPERFAETLDLTLGLVRMLEKQPVLLGRLVAIAIEALMYNEVRAALIDRPQARWLDACECVLKKYEDHADRSLPFEGERVSSKDSVCWVFSDPARARFGKYSPALHAGLRGWMVTSPIPEGRLGKLDENLAAVDTFYDGLVDASKQPRFKRQQPAPLVNDLLLVNLLVPAVDKALRSQDQIEIDRAAVPLLIALERYRLEKGAYPATLAELAPRYLEKWGGVVPLDPWSGKPFCYKRIDATKDEQKRGFLLYATGQDGVDDGGISGVNPWVGLTGSGVDYIINDVKR